jgi:hypothetical protein
MRICDDPSMPCYATVWKWRRERPEFDEALTLARQAQAERLAEKGMDIAEAICVRIASGESLSAICEDEGMPHRATVSSWAEQAPQFRAQLHKARAAAGWNAAAGRPPSYCEATAQAIFERMLAGETLTAICDAPDMPSYPTVWRWRRDHREFDDALKLARQAQAERLAERALELAEAITPKTAFATKVQLAQLRWAAGVLAPSRFGRFRPVESSAAREEPPPPPPPPPPQVAYYPRFFKLEERKADGALRVVGFGPDPKTGLPRRETESEWRVPEGNWSKRTFGESNNHVRERAARGEPPLAPDDPEGWR